jgi:hypothetical protein
MKTTTASQNQHLRRLTTTHLRRLAIALGLFGFTALVSPTFAADDVVPFFAGANGAPNIMFIFDNSDSMQDIPNTRADSRPVRPGTNPNSINNSSAQDWKWRQGVQLNADGTVKESGGVVQYDPIAFPSDTQMTMPEQSPALLPHLDPLLDSLTSTADVTDPATPLAIPELNPANLPDTTGLTGTVTNITQPARIYDANLNWSTTTGLGNATVFGEFLYRLVEVKSNLGDVQYRTITGRTIGGAPINTTSYFTFEGGNITYVAGRTYTYTVLTDGPGRATRNSGTSTVTDADVNWSAVNSSWIGRLLTVTSGTNAGQTRTISGYSASNKAWTVSSAFPTACNHTSYYEIKDVATNTARIYDSSLDWATAGNSLNNTALFESNYRYRIVRLVSDTGTVQERTILSRDITGKYFTVDISAAAGGPLVYDPAERPYTYTIVTDGPARVTRLRTDNLRLVTDADFDWSTITSWTDFSSKWLNRSLVITTGTNKDEKRRITGYSVSEKRWEVDSAFPVACNLTTRFKILGVPDDERLAFGGNHPASKLYQAKKAMNLFLNDPSLQTCVATNADGNCTSYEYAVNIGLATYLSARVPRITARYYRIQPGSTVTPPLVPDRYCGTYKRTIDESGTFYHPTLSDTFTASGWSTAPVGSTAYTTATVHSGVSVGYQFDRMYSQGNCDQQVIRYTVTNIDPAPGSDGSLPDQKKYTVRSRVAQASEGGRWQTSRRCYAVASCGALPATDGSFSLIPSGSPCFLACSFSPGYQDPPYTTPDLYQTIYRDTFGRYNITNTTVPQYVDPTTHLVNPYPGYSGTGSTPKNPPYLSGDYQLITTPLLGVPTGYNTTTGVTTYSDIYPDSFDTSYFMYPGYGTEERPHGWSYKKTHDSSTPPNPISWIYGTSGPWDSSNTDFPKVGSAGRSNPTYPWPGHNGSWLWSNWADTAQTNPFFPAAVGDEMAHFAGDDQVVFVNLPVYDGFSPSYGDDISGANIAKILEYVDLTRYPSPDDSSSWAQSFDYTIMPYTRSIAPNAYSALYGSGTPIAASLSDLKRYYTDYIKQDSMTQGGCRKNYVIFLTDGLETGGGDPKKAAEALMNLTIDGNKYPIRTYVIGFGLDAASKSTLDAIALAGGTEKAYFADNVETLVNILVNEITSSIIGDNYSRSAPVITPYVGGSNLQLYSSRFDYPVWRGHFYAYDVDPDTVTITGPATGWNSDCDNDAASLPDGDAGCEMKHFGRGKVYTSIFDTVDNKWDLVEFNPNIATTVSSLAPLINNNPPINIDGIGGINDLDTETIMRYTLDPGHDGAKYKGTRDPNWPLGDIYHSGPVVVSAPTFTPPPATGVDPYLGYADFKEANKNRETRIFVGANDGMVHAFRSDNGREDWAYIPNAVLGKIREFKEGHRFTVDLPIRAVDIYSPGGPGTRWDAVTPGNEKDGWHTLIASGLRDGGYSYFALDVTNISNPQVAWEVTDVDSDPATPDMGKTWSIPSFARILINGVRTYVMIVGGGVSAEENRGNNLYIIDAGSGAILKEIPVGTSTNNVPSQILLVTETDDSSPYYRYTTKGYFGDTSGDLYKLTNLNDEAGGADWDPGIELLYDGQGKVFHRPAITTSKGGCKVTVNGVEYTINPNTTFILYGTGDEQNPTDIGSTDRIYEIADPPLTPVASPPPFVPPLRKVWERSFPVAEKMLSVPFTSLNTVYFTTYTPEGGCAQGESFLWGLTTTKCGQMGSEAGLVYDLAGNKTDNPAENYSLGAGISSSPTDAGSAIFIETSTPDDEGKFPPLRVAKPTVDRLEYWREVLQ